MSKKPNILLITYDQQRYDCVGASNMRPVKTPNINRIADNGVYFERCYTPIPVCAPARQAMMTARRPEQYGALWNPGAVFEVKSFPNDYYTFQRALAKAGYLSTFIGSWEGHEDNPPSFFGYHKTIGNGEIKEEIAKKYPNVEYTNSWFGCESPIPLEDCYTHKCAGIVNDEIDELCESGKPWFMHVDNIEPHLPVRPSYPFSKMYDPDEIEPWGTLADTYEGKPYIHRQQILNWRLEGRTWDDWKSTVALYYGLISQYDDALGRILDHLEERGLMEDTIIIYTCDHGDMCGSHNMIDKHVCMYDDLLHIPLAIRWDGHIKPHNRFTGFCHQCLDVPPTLISLLGEELDPEWKYDGVDLSKYLLNGESTDGRDYAVSCYNGMQFGLMTLRAITTERYKYVWNCTDIDELYDHKNDPYELHNLIYEEGMKDIISDLRKKLHKELKHCHDPILGWLEPQLLENRKI